MLTNFIQRCFTKSQWSVFESALGNIYLDAFSEDILLDGLTYLLGSGRLSTVDPKWFFIHGQRDTIAPFSELYSFLETHEALGQLTSCPRFRHWPELAVLTGV